MKCLRALDALRLRHARDLEREGDILDDRAPREGRFLLEHHADRLMRAGDRLAGDRDLAFVAVEQPADDIEQRGLAAAGRADHREEFARRHVERHVVDRGEHAFGRLECFDTSSTTSSGAAVAARGAASRRVDRHHAFLSRHSTWPPSWPACSPARRAHRPPRPAPCFTAAMALANVRPSWSSIFDGPEAERALRARQRREVDVGIADALADPVVLDRPVAHARDALLVHFVVVEGAIVGDHDQQRNAVMRRCPERGGAHQEIAVAADGDRKAAGSLERERRADRDAGAAAEAAAAVGAKEVERMVERPPRAVP